MAGKVYLVGAGPGDPGLITMRGRDLIRRADVILYDALINTELLEIARDSCEKYYVGKRPGGASISQAAINSEMIRHARDDKRVVRLKGGDPYIYGRGGEEVMACSAAGIPVEVVPGVTSAISVPAYAGIPLLQRNLAGTVIFLHGRLKCKKEEVLSPDADTPMPAGLHSDSDIHDEETRLDMPDATCIEPASPDAPTQKLSRDAVEEKEKEKEQDNAGERRGGVIIRRRKRREDNGAPLAVAVAEQPAEKKDKHLDPTEDIGADMEVDWEAVCKAADTIVVLMGMKSLDAIREGLLSGGRPAHQPVAVIQWGTTPYQKTLISTVDKFPEEVREARLGNPGIIVIGEVVNLHGELDSYERRPLFGWRMAVAECDELAHELAESVFEQGGRPVLLGCARAPMLAATSDELTHLASEFQKATHIIFVSPQVVPLFIEAAGRSGINAEALLSGLRILAKNQETHEVLHELGYDAQRLAPDMDERQFRAVYGGSISRSRAIVVEPEDEWSELSDDLEEAGARVINVPLSEYTADEDAMQRLTILLERKELQAVYFPAPWPAKALLKFWGAAAQNYLAQVAVIAADETTAQVLNQGGIKPSLTVNVEEPASAMEQVAAWKCGNENTHEDNNREKTPAPAGKP